MKASPLIVFLFGITNLAASEVRWTARGTVSSLTGAAFAETDVAAGDIVEISLVYDSNSQVNGQSYLPIGEVIAGRAWFHGAVGLGITVKIGDKIWTGEMPNIPSTENVLESVCWDFGGNPDTSM
jgi:hypothetical protein